MDYKDKIRKLLALAKSPEPEEAKLALLKARKLMADGAECKCGNCGRHETFTSFDRHTDHIYCCRCGYKMEGLTNE